MSNSLWHPYKIPIVVLAGEPDSGKTMWGLTVDDSCLDFSKSPTTILWDTELSSDPYVGALNFQRVNLPEIAIKDAGENYRNIDLYYAWLKSMKSIESGQYSVGIIDTATEIEDGLTQYMKANPGNFGYTSAQFTKAGGLFWGALKSEWKRLLLYTASKLQTLVISVHMKAEWKGKVTTGRRIPKGKEVLMDVASLYMTLTRRMRPGVKIQSPRPSGITCWPAGKSRLNRINPDTGQPQQLLPPFITDASPDGIRAYLKNPPNFSNLKPSERALPDIELTADDKLSLQAGIAADELSKAESDLERIKLEKEVQENSVISIDRIERLAKVKKDLIDAVGLDNAKLFLIKAYDVSKLSKLNSEQLTDLEKRILTLAKN